MVDMYRCTGPGCEEVDLDDLSTYPASWLHLSTKELFDLVWSKLGQSLVYMDYFHGDVDWEPQRSRVVKMCEEFAKEYVECLEETPKNMHRLMKFLYKVDDEVENQC